MSQLGKENVRNGLILSILLIISVLTSIQNIFLGVDDFWGGHYTFYNNFVIFKNSFSHLVDHKNLYDLYLDEYADYFKYSPTFALLFSGFHYLPNGIGLVIWNSLNILALYFALISIKSIDPSKKYLLFIFLIFELILSIQSSQCNAVLAALTILAFIKFEKGENSLATLFIVLGAFIKIYSVLGLLLLLLYPNKLKSIISAIIWTLLFLGLPLLVINFSELTWQYKNWFVLLKADQDQSVGMSIYTYTQYILPASIFKITTLVFGILILLSPLLKFNLLTELNFRLKYLSLILIWMVVFNYKAESPTFIIAMVGIAIWAFSSKPAKTIIILTILAFIFTSIWSTDIIPKTIRAQFISLNILKPLLPILIFLKISMDLLLSSPNKKTEIPFDKTEA